MKRKYCFTALLSFILCALLLPGCQELFHPGSNDDDNNNNGSNNNGNNSVLIAPTGLNAYISGGYFYGSWRTVSGAEWYEIFVSDTPNGSYEYWATGYGTSYSAYIGTDLEFSKYIKIRACSNGKESPFSAYFYLNSGYEPPPDALTVTVTVSGTTSSSVSLSWNSSNGASYFVERQDSIFGDYYTVIDGLTATSWTDTGLAANTTYYYKVSAYTSQATGESAVVSATTSAEESQGIPLTFDQWTPNTLSTGGSHSYTFFANAGTTYYITWDDHYDGSSAYTGDVKVSASINGVELFSGIDSGYSSPKPVTVPSSGTVIIEVLPYGSSYSGSYAIKYY
jgi:hypothetical protein